VKIVVVGSLYKVELCRGKRGRKRKEGKGPQELNRFTVKRTEGGTNSKTTAPKLLLLPQRERGKWGKGNGRPFITVKNDGIRGRGDPYKSCQEKVFSNPVLGHRTEESEVGKRERPAPVPISPDPEGKGLN